MYMTFDLQAVHTSWPGVSEA